MNNRTCGVCKALFAAAFAISGPAQADEIDVNRWRAADAERRHTVLALARRAFEAYALRREVIEPSEDLPAALRQRSGVFVSAMRNGAPRCCMGTLYPAEPNIAREIIANAVAAAGRDRRFAPVKPQELKSLILIVSIVGRPRPIRAEETASLDPTHDALVVKNGDRSGVVLSCETTRVDRMVAWARTRAGASSTSPVSFFRLDDVRFVEQIDSTPVATKTLAHDLNPKSENRSKHDARQELK